ncbi:hypothetical protein [Acetobacter senegalensis]|uniref:hypothetical protein n=1 Tax=Acetobacter senegalensis TaxID=446692 RepID=UPI00128D21DE|nr:hypothetical protein [Acetobacter senegalensis]MPQ75261.1 hypothetical protein [Acetobacter senegalensis]
MSLYQGKLQAKSLRQNDENKAILHLWQEALKHVPQEERMRLLEEEGRRNYPQWQLWKSVVSALRDYVPHPQSAPTPAKSASDLPTLFDEPHAANPPVP